MKEIAIRLVAQDESHSAATEDEAKLQRTTVSLHHNYLPRLAKAGVIRYDRDAQRVSYNDHTSVKPDWKAVADLEELVSRVQTKDVADERAIGVLEGREDVYEYCRELADRADDELFLIYTSDELLYLDENSKKNH